MDIFRLAIWRLDLTEFQAIDEFWPTLRLAVKRAALYPVGHPSLTSFLSELKEKLDVLTASSGSFRFGVSPKSIRLQDGTWLKERKHEEVARMLHWRRIQSITFRKGVTLDELGYFVRALSGLPPEYKGKFGLKKFLEEKGVTHITVEMLDYSPLFEGGKEEIKDVWSFLLEDLASQRKPEEVQQAAQGFLHALGQYPLEEIIAEERTAPHWTSFFMALKEIDGRTFKSLAAALVKNMLALRTKPSSVQLEEKFSALLENLDEEVLAASLFEVMNEDISFNVSSLNQWFRLTKSKKHGLIAAFLERIFTSRLSRLSSSALRSKLASFLQDFSTSPYPTPYYHVFTRLLSKIPEEKGFMLNREEIWKHEFSLCLFLLEKENRPEQLLSHFATSARSLSRLLDSRDFLLLREYHRLLLQRQKVLGLHEDYIPTIRRLSRFIEELILNEEAFPEQEYFIEHLNASTLGVNYYLQKIFGEERVSSAALKLFFRLFLEHMFYFDINLEEKAKDREFLEKMIISLQEVDLPASFVTLKNIFNLGDASLKKKALRAMQRISTFDENFLWLHFRERPLTWQREALLLLRKKPASLDKALSLLLDLKSPFGLKNKWLLEAANLVEDLNLTEAVPYLQRLSQRPFFWNRRLRKEINRILRSWNGC